PPASGWRSVLPSVKGSSQAGLASRGEACPEIYKTLSVFLSNITSDPDHLDACHSATRQRKTSLDFPLHGKNSARTARRPSDARAFHHQHLHAFFRTDENGFRGHGRGDA